MTTLRTAALRPNVGPPAEDLARHLQFGETVGGFTLAAVGVWAGRKAKEAARPSPQLANRTRSTALED